MTEPQNIATKQIMPVEIHQPKISVLMSVYNGEAYLHEAIESILNQTLTNFEFLIIDDGSTDSSRSIIKSYNDPRILLICNQQNLGLPASLNKGVTSTKGQYIARQDADDLSLPERLELQSRELDSRSSIGVVGCWWQNIDHNRHIFEEMVVPTEGPILLQRMLNLALNPSPHGSMMMRAELVRKVGGYDERFWFTQDFDLWLRMWNHTEFAVLPKFLYQLRKLPQGNRFKELCQEKYSFWAVKQFQDNQRHEFEDVREFVAHKSPDATKQVSYNLAKYWAVLSVAAMCNKRWKLGVLYALRIFLTGNPITVGLSLTKLLLAGIRKIVSK